MASKLVYWDNPWLRKKAEPHTKITPEVKKFIKEMLFMMTEGELATTNSIPIGLAATQIQSTYRIFIVCPYQGDEAKERWGAPKVFVNPRLSEPSPELEMLDEGCLSFPALYLPIVRPSSITVEYEDPEGQTHKEQLSGYYARQVMHENDHLNGVVFVDRLSKNMRKRLKTDLDALKKRYKDK